MNAEKIRQEVMEEFAKKNNCMTFEEFKEVCNNFNKTHKCIDAEWVLLCFENIAKISIQQTASEIRKEIIEQFDPDIKKGDF